jgi:hypothetical protein
MQMKSSPELISIAVPGLPCSTPNNGQRPLAEGKSVKMVDNDLTGLHGNRAISSRDLDR